jgi:hypothetical protein
MRRGVGKGMSYRHHFRRLFPSATPLRQKELNCFRRDSRNRSRTCSCALLAAAVVLSLGPTASLAKEEHLDQLGRILLIRGLDREIAVAKMTLPRGKHGLFIDDTGKVEQDEAEKELRSNGAAIQPGLPVEITRIKFKDHAITFVINNGGKNHKKWYQHIQIGMGGDDMVQPIDGRQNPIAFGSYITLNFKDQKVPDLSVDQAKKLLSVALDFHRQLPTELYSPKLPEKFKNAIKNHQVLVGMDKDAVLSAKGTPFRKVREDKPNGEETEDWLYGLPPHVLFVTFNGDTVVKVHQY